MDGAPNVGGFAPPMGGARIDLNELSRRENEQTEWKEAVADVDNVVATLCAFANDLQNLGGGYVVCGAREGKDDHGFPVLIRLGLTASRLKEVENQVLARCRERVSPAIAPLVEELESADSGRRILVFLQPRTGSAHSFRRGNDGAKHFVRVSRSTIKARNGLLKDLLVRKGAMEPWDRRLCQAATTDDIDLLVLREALVPRPWRSSTPDFPTQGFARLQASLSARIRIAAGHGRFCSGFVDARASTRCWLFRAGHVRKFALPHGIALDVG